MASPAATRLPIGDIDLAATLRNTAILPGDPTVRLEPGRFVRATITPDGTGEIRVVWADGVAAVEAWGDGAEWLIERAPRLLGLEDDVTGFDPDGPLRDVWRRNHRTRIAATGTVWHDLAALIPQQRVRFVDAADNWRQMVRAWGEAGPGPNELLLPPDPAAMARRSYVEFHRFGIERSRAQILVNAAKVAGRLHRSADQPWAEAAPRLGSIRGVGPWTMGGLQGVTWGDPDTVITGDIGFPGAVGWFFERDERADDARMLELLEPFRPHRYRVLNLVLGSGVSPPRKHHRLAKNPIQRR